MSRGRRRHRCEGPGRWVAGALALLACAATAAEAPRDEGYEESVEVVERSVLVRIEPRDGRPLDCQAIRREELVLEIDGAEVPIVAVVPAAAPRALGGAAGRLQVVFLIDLFHNVCATCEARAECCPTYLPGTDGIDRAFGVVRTFARDAMRPGDRVMVATLISWPLAETGWIEDRDELLAAVDRIEQRVVAGGEPVLSDIYREKPLSAFFRALGRYDGIKDVVMPMCHLPVRPSVDVRELAASAARNGVMLHAVDLMGCGGIEADCEPFHAISALPLETGGVKLDFHRDAAGVFDRLREVVGCRQWVHFRQEDWSRRGRFGHTVRVWSRDRRFRVRLASAVDDGVSVWPEEWTAGLPLLSDYRAGLQLAAQLWPIAPEPRRRGTRWRSLAVLRARVVGPLPEEQREVEEIEFRLRIGARSKSREQEFVWRLRDERLERLLGRREPAAFAVPVSVPVGPIDLVAMASSPDMDLGSVDRIEMEVPPAPPGPGPVWHVAEDLVRIGGALLPVPTETEAVPADRPWTLVGCSCRGRRPGGRPLLRSSAGEFVALRTRPLPPLEKLLAGAGPRCRCWTGWPERPLTGDRWTLLADRPGASERPEPLLRFAVRTDR